MLPGEAAAAAAPRKAASGALAASSARRPPLLALVFPGGTDAEADGRAAGWEALVRVRRGTECCGTMSSRTSIWQRGAARCGQVLPLCMQGTL